MDKQKELFQEIRLGNIEVVKNILQQDINLLNSKDERGSTPLLLACYYGEKLIVEYLLQLPNISIDEKDKSGNNSLMGVCFKGYYDIAEKLINAGANVNAVNYAKATALIYAATFNRPEMVKLLLAHGADSSLKDAQGKTALDYAKYQGLKELSEFLIS